MVLKRLPAMILLGIALAILIGSILGGSASAKPHLTFQGSMEISGDDSFHLVGDTITIIVRIVNEGDENSTDVDVGFYVDGNEYKVQTLIELSGNGSDPKTVIFTWVAEEGDHLLEVRIDPEGKIDDAGNGQRILSREIEVGGSPGIIVEEEETSLVFLPLIIISTVCTLAFFIVVAAIVIFLIFRSKW